MKRVLAMIMAAVMMLSLCACGAKTEAEIRGQVTAAGESAAEAESAGEAAAEAEAELGTVNGGRYESSFLGIGCELDENWSYYSQEDMASLLESADVYLTKPGGLSSTEAAVAAVPMVFIDAVAGCEEYNLRYFCDRGCALAGWAAEDTAALCLSLLQNAGLREEMRRNLQALALPNGAEEIYAYLSR